MSVKDLINAISMGNAAETQELFQAVMAEKVSARLDDMRVEVARNMFKEEAEQIDEIIDYNKMSLKTLMKHYNNHRLNAAKATTHTKKLHHTNQAGIIKAVYDKKLKLQKESVETIDELSKNTLGYFGESLEDYSLEELEDFMMSEDFEQLDELSKKTLSNYIKKAGRQIKKNDSTMEKWINRKVDTSKLHKGNPYDHDAQTTKRKEGVAKAVDKLAKKELD